MNTGKYILLLSLMILLPVFAVGQIRNITKREAEQIGKNTYVTTTGEVTKVVKTVGSGLDDEYSIFLTRKINNPEIDSIFSEINTSYTSLEEAAYDTDQLLREVNKEKQINFENNRSLSFRISKGIRDYKKKENEAASRIEDLLSKDPTVEDLALLYIQYGDKPTYYINGVEVPHNLVNQLYPNEVVKKEFKTTDTASGNPNGEIWYLVTDRALKRIKIPKEYTYDYTSNYASSGSSMPATGTQRTASGEINLDKFLKDQEREKVKSGLKPMPVVRRVQTPDGGYIETIVEDVNKNEEVAAPSYKDGTSSSSTPPGTRVLSRTVNNTNVGTVEDPVAKALREQRSQPVFRQNNVINIEGQKPAVNNNPLHQPSVTPEEEKTEIKVPESTPRRSVRRIKAKEQSQYQGE